MLVPMNDFFKIGDKVKYKKIKDHIMTIQGFLNRDIALCSYDRQDQYEGDYFEEKIIHFELVKQNLFPVVLNTVESNLSKKDIFIVFYRYNTKELVLYVQSLFELKTYCFDGILIYDEDKVIDCAKAIYGRIIKDFK